MLTQKHIMRVIVGCSVVAIVGSVLLFSGCATVPKPAFTNCVSETLAAGYTYGMLKRIPVRVIEQRLPEGRHVQAEALIDDKWAPLTCVWLDDEKRFAVIKYRRHFDSPPTRCMTFQEFLQDRGPWVASPPGDRLWGE